MYLLYSMVMIHYYHYLFCHSKCPRPKYQVFKVYLLWKNMYDISPSFLCLPPATQSTGTPFRPSSLNVATFSANGPPSMMLALTKLFSPLLLLASGAKDCLLLPGHFIVPCWSPSRALTHVNVPSLTSPQLNSLSATCYLLAADWHGQHRAAGRNKWMSLQSTWHTTQDWEVLQKCYAYFCIRTSHISFRGSTGWWQMQSCFGRDQERVMFTSILL